MRHDAEEPMGSTVRADGRRVLSLVAALASTALLVLTTATALAPAAESEPAYLGQFGPDGTSSTDFEQIGPIAVDQETGYVYVGDTVKGALYKFDEAGQPVNFGGSEPYISGNEISGIGFSIANGESQIAVDSDSHVVYVTEGNSVRAFEEDGEPHGFSAGPGAGTSAIPGAGKVAGVAVDSSSNIYAADYSGKKIRIYTAAGALLSEVPTPAGSPANLAVSPNGDLFVVESSNRARKMVPSEFPVTASTTYTTELEPFGSSYTISVAVDPVTRFVYLTEIYPVEFPTFPRVEILDEHGQLVGTLGEQEQEGTLEGRPLGVAIASEKRVYVSERAESAPFHSRVKMYEPFTFFVGPPTVTNTAVTGLSSTAATLRGRINPNTFDTEYWFEYGLSDCAAAPGTCTQLPAVPAAIGSGHEPVRVSHPLSGLTPGATYHYRLVAENAEEVTKGPLRTFTAQGAATGFEPMDGRVWEQVSPTKKFGGGVTNVLAQAAADGNGIAFGTRGSLVERPDGNRALELAAVLARREAGRWRAEDLVAAHDEATQFNPAGEYKVFSHNLERAIIEPRDTNQLSPEASEFTAYLRHNTTPPAFRPLVTSKEGFANVPPGTIFGGKATGAKNPIALSAANEGLTDVVIVSEAPLLPGAEKRALYLWQDGSLEPVSEMPADEGGGIVTAQPGSGAISVSHAVSEDGSRVFWSPGESLAASLNLPALYLRDTETDETVRLDEAQPGASEDGAERPAFVGASADGSVVFFTDTQQLTPDASTDGRSLYRCQIGVVEGALGCADLTNVTVPVDSGEIAEAEEFTAALADDGESIYFVALGVLDLQPNQEGDIAQPEQPNLYSWQEGEGARFIATLSVEDRSDWGQPGALEVGQMSGTSAYASPSGRYLTFMSERNLTGDESNDPETGEPTEEVFLYDSLTENLSCVSCNPFGGTDLAHEITASGSEGSILFPDSQQLWKGRFVGATLPESTESEPTKGYSFYQPRAVLDNGRVFFNSPAPLVPADSNGTWDVYQYEPLGLGSCGPSSEGASVARTEEGCIGLISPGTDSEFSVFLDASESGDDLFFATSARLSVLDTDEEVDVYDARVNGVEAKLPDDAECLGEACQPAAEAPDGVTPASAAFRGQGNPKPGVRKRCGKGKRLARRQGRARCVPRNRHSAGRSHGRAHHDRRGQR